LEKSTKLQATLNNNNTKSLQKKEKKGSSAPVENKLQIQTSSKRPSIPTDLTLSPLQKSGSNNKIEASPMNVSSLLNQSSSSANSPVQQPLQSQLNSSMFSVYPLAMDFGALCQGQVYSMACTLSNFGKAQGRFVIKNNSLVQSKEIRLVYKKGPVAAGMNVKLEVEVQATAPKDLTGDLEISTESGDILIPFRASM